MDKDKKLALYEATIREILRLEKKADADDTALSFDDIFDNNRDAKEWKSIRLRAANLLKH